MTPACLQLALRSYVKASKKSRSIMVLAAYSHSSRTPNANSKHWFTTSVPPGRCRKAMLGLGVCKNGQAERCATNRPVPVLSLLRPPLSLVFFFHQQPVHWVRSTSEASIVCLPSVHTNWLGQRSFSYDAPSVWKSFSCKDGPNMLTSLKSSLKSHLFKLSY